MPVPETAKSNIVQFDPVRRNINQHIVEKRIKDGGGTAHIVRELGRQHGALVAKTSELEEKNLQLEEENEGLRSALEGAEQRLAQYDRTRIVAAKQSSQPSHAVPPCLAVPPIPAASTETPAPPACFNMGTVNDLSQFTQQLARLLQTVSSPGGEMTGRSRSLVIDSTEQHCAANMSPATVEQTSHEPSAKPHCILLTASPFKNFASLSAFHRALQQLPGVVGARPDGFRDGRLSVVIHYANDLPFAGRLTELSQFDLRLISITEEQVEVAFLG